MAFSKVPTDWLENWGENGTDITVPIATFPELTAAEADGATGDIRKILFAICEKLWSEWSGRVLADKPTKMTLTKIATTNTETGVVTNTYTLRFYTSVVSQEVIDEPV